MGHEDVDPGLPVPAEIAALPWWEQMPRLITTLEGLATAFTDDRDRARKQRRRDWLVISGLLALISVAVAAIAVLAVTSFSRIKSGCVTDNQAKVVIADVFGTVREATTAAAQAATPPAGAPQQVVAEFNRQQAVNRAATEKFFNEVDRKLAPKHC